MRKISYFNSISHFLWSVFKFFIVPRFRAEQLARIRYTDKIIQVSTFTKSDRYPVLFQNIAEELKEVKYPKILSFGCSTGEEVFSLKRLIPNAEITGTDINHWCVKIASKKNEYSDCSFVVANDESWQKEKIYDCILALAVFQKTIHRNPEIMNSISSFSFTIFEETIIMLNKLIKANGLLVIEHSDYQFTDLELFKQEYTLGINSEIVRQRPIYNKYNNKISQTSSSNRIFKKIN